MAMTNYDCMHYERVSSHVPPPTPRRYLLPENNKPTLFRTNKIQGVQNITFAIRALDVRMTSIVHICE